MKNKSLFSRLLDNKKLLIVLSLVLAFLFWIVSSDDISKTITEVELNYSLSEGVSKDLKIYSASVETVSVNVTGKRVVIDSLSPDDIKVSVDLSGVTKAGQGTYPIIAERSGALDFEIESVEPDSITLMIDKEATKTVDVISDFTYSPDGYYVDNNAPATVEITGPESVVNTVKSAYISGNVNSPNASTVTNSYEIKLYDMADPKANGAQEISKEYITMSMASVDVSFRYLKIDEDMPFALKYEPSDVKLPSSYYSISPSTISVAGPEAMIEGNQAIEKIAIDIGSLSQYKNQIYNEEFNLNDILGADFINKSDGVETIKVQLDFSYLNSETFDIPSNRMSIKNLPEGYTYSVPSNFPVTTIGTSSALQKLTEDDFTIEYDFSGITGTTETNVDVPVTISVNSNGLCWVYRTSDTVSVLLEAE